jgi:hypothetical protein
MPGLVSVEGRHSQRTLQLSSLIESRNSKTLVLILGDVWKLGDPGELNRQHLGSGSVAIAFHFGCVDIRRAEDHQRSGDSYWRPGYSRFASLFLGNSVHSAIALLASDMGMPGTFAL